LWRVFSLQFEYISERPGTASFRVTGKGADEIFRPEVGVHRFQRVPPTEKRGRTHTSSITVACLFETTSRQQSGKDINPTELDYSYYRSRGPGGQHKNKTYSAVRLRHKPTGIVVHAQFGRSQSKNKQTALKILRAKISELKSSEEKNKRNRRRKEQVGRGSRGEKIRTYNVKKDLVVNHKNGRRMSFKRFTKGHIQEIHS